jgi:uncharacterized protein (UPF0264 family)
MPGPHLLVSVRDAAEAAAALAGGADLIDVKEPSRGPLGRADTAAIAAVIEAVGGRAPVSAALGELRECPLVGIAADLPDGLSFVKWGLSGMLRGGWNRAMIVARLLFAENRASKSNTGPQWVTVAYADWVPAEAPRPADIVAALKETWVKVILFDTFQKDGATLLDWMSVKEIAALVRSCQEFDVKVALAGSLTAHEIDRLRTVRPDWFAVRGAACDGGRGGIVSERRVRELADLVHSHG